MKEDSIGQGVLRSVFGGYTREHRPLGAYAVLVAAFHAVFGGFLYATKAAGQPLPTRIGPGDLLVLGVATHKLSRTLARDFVTSVLRAPFTRLKGEAELPKELEEEARGEGMRRAIGELVTCPFCTAQWVAALLTYLLVLNPRLGRLVASVFTVNALSDFLQAAWVITGNKMEQAGSKGGESEGGEAEGDQQSQPERPSKPQSHQEQLARAA